MKKVADWEIKHHDDLAYRAQNSRLSRGKHDMLDWTNGALYVGMSKWAAMADSEKYFDWLKGIGEDHDWKLHMRNGYYARVFSMLMTIPLDKHTFIFTENIKMKK